MGHRYEFLGGGISRTFRDVDFEEQDVWDVIKERSGKSELPRKPVSRHISSTARVIPGANYSRNSICEVKNIKQQSAPVNIPDWSKIHEKRNAASWLEDIHEEDDNWESDGEDDYRMPPHEIIDRRAARSEISSFSVFEGAGRTLKGRDLSKVRDGVLRKTGFLE